MHELSIAQSLLRLVAEHVPPGAILRIVRVSAGPLQAIDPESLRWAWESVLQGHPFEGARLEFSELPWQMQCPQCGETWQSPQCDHVCACGCDRAYPVGGHDLILDSLEVDEHSLTH